MLDEVDDIITLLDGLIAAAAERERPERERDAETASKVAADNQARVDAYARTRDHVRLVLGWLGSVECRRLLAMMRDHGLRQLRLVGGDRSYLALDASGDLIAHVHGYAGGMGGSSHVQGVDMDRLARQNADDWSWLADRVSRNKVLDAIVERLQAQGLRS